MTDPNSCPQPAYHFNIAEALTAIAPLANQVSNLNERIAPDRLPPTASNLYHGSLPSAPVRQLLETVYQTTDFDAIETQMDGRREGKRDTQLWQELKTQARYAFDFNGNFTGPDGLLIVGKSLLSGLDEMVPAARGLGAVLAITHMRKAGLARPEKHATTEALQRTAEVCKLTNSELLQAVAIAAQA